MKTFKCHMKSKHPNKSYKNVQNFRIIGKTDENGIRPSKNHKPTSERQKLREKKLNKSSKNTKAINNNNNNNKNNSNNNNDNNDNNTNTTKFKSNCYYWW